ncbi:reverse transcriptase domain-containing protein, partial [Tanacetum coccineum]
FDETFSEACDRFKDLLRKCPHHGFLELHQIDTFYNALTQSDQDSLNAAAGGNLLNRTPRDALAIIESKSKVRSSRNKPIVSKVSITTSSLSHSPDVTALTNIVKELVLMNKATQQATVKAIEETCVTCGGQNPYYECLATGGNTFDACAALGTYNQGGNGYRLQGDLNYHASNQIGPPFSECARHPSGKTRSLNLIGDLKAITTRSGVAYDGPTIPPTSSPLPKEVERETEATKDKVQTTSSESTAHVRPLVVQIPISEPEVAPKPNPKPSIPYPLRLNDQKLHEKSNNQMLKFLQIFQILHFDISFADALLHMPKFASTFKSLLSNPEKLFELPNTPLNENYECLALADLGASINLMPLSVWKKLSLLELTPTCMTLELADRSVAHPKGVAEDVFVKVGKIYFLDDFVVVDYDVDPRVPLILGRPFLRTARALIDVHGEELTLRVNDEAITMLKKCSDYSDSSTSGNPTPSDPIIASSSPSFTPFEGGDFILEEIEACLSSDLIPPGIDDADFDPEGDIRLLEKLLNKYSSNYYDETVHQVNVIDVACEEYAQEVLRFLDSSTSGNPTPSDPIISSLSPSFTPFEGGDFVLEEIEACLSNDSIPPGIDDANFDPEGDIRLLEKLLNEDPYPTLPPMKNDDLKQVDVTLTKPSIKEPPELEHKDLPSHLEYAFLEGTNKLPVIISKELKEEEKAVLLKEKCHFMVKEGIVLGHKISKSEIEVDRAKVDVIAKLPHPTSVKGV